MFISMFLIFILCFAFIITLTLLPIIKINCPLKGVLTQVSDGKICQSSDPETADLGISPGDAQ